MAFGWLRPLLFAMAALLALGSCSKNSSGQKEQHPAQVSEKLVGVQESNSLLEGIPQDGVSLGDPNAPVVLTEFADLQCPFCAAVSVVTLPKLIDEYVRKGKVRLVFRNLAFLGPDSVKAAQMAGAAGLQDKLYQFVEIFLHNQGDENSGFVTDDFLRNIANAIPGLDVDRAFSDRDSDAVKEQLEAAREEASEFDIRGTPAFLLGKAGEKPEELHPRTLDPAYFAEQIDALLPKEKAE